MTEKINPIEIFMTMDETKYLERREYFLNYIIENCWDSNECKYIVKEGAKDEMNKILAEEFPIQHRNYMKKNNSNTIKFS